MCVRVLAGKRSIEVLELGAIEREYMLVHARLQLLQQDPDPAHMAGLAATHSLTLTVLPLFCA